MNSNQTIPFVELVAPLFEGEKENLIQNFVNDSRTVINKKVINKLITNRIEKLSYTAQFCYYEDFKDRKLRKSSSTTQFIKNTNNLYNQFVTEHQKNELKQFYSNYPVLKNVSLRLKETLKKTDELLLHRISADYSELEKYFGIQKTDNISNIIKGSGDTHLNGQSVCIIEFNSGKKIVYKPRNISIVNKFNKIFAWIGEKIGLESKGIIILDKVNYGWMEFISFKPCQNNKEVQEYYKKAGMLLAISYFLNSTDFHFENIIASKNSPVLIDYETIMQPNLENQINNAFGKEFVNSVMRSSLLPTMMPGYGIPHDCMTGFGALNNNLPTTIKRKIHQANTDSCFRALINIPLIEKNTNVPEIDGIKKRVNQFKKEIVYGFTQSYQTILKNKHFLLNNNLILDSFFACKQRYIFRPTKVYASILEIVLEPKYMRNIDLYNDRINLLSKAFDLNPQLGHLRPILDSEINQISNGDVPIFYFYPNSKSIYLPDGKEIVNVFKTTSIEDIKRKIQKSDLKDMEHQIMLINKSLNGKFC